MAVLKPPTVVVPRSVMHTAWRGQTVTLTPAHRLRSNHPLVKQVGADAFVAERSDLDFED